MRNTLKEIRNYVVPSTKELPHEDIIPNIVVEGEVANKLANLDDFLSVERELKRIDHQFMGFYMDIPYPRRIRKMVVDHANIMEKMPKGRMGEEERVCLDSPEPDVVLEEEEDDVPEASWVTKGNKRQKVVHVLDEVKKRTLQILPGNS